MHGINGLFQPYSTTGNTAYKTGSTIPLKWQYTDYTGKAVDSSEAEVTVSYKLVAGTIENEVQSSGSSGLRYNEITMTWQINWQTKGLVPGLYEIIIYSGLTGQEEVFQIMLR